jgi:peptidoglycan/LPS O-acetylase OafA/YrhL
MTEQRQSAGEIRALTGLRGVAAVDVMLSHYNAPGFSILRFIEFHNPAVDLFFCLSAFTLCLAYKAGDSNRISWWDFAVARFARIYPLYLVCLIVSVHLIYVASNQFLRYPSADMIRDGIEQVLLISNWPIIGHGVSWNVAAWSISVETFCYVCLFYPAFALSRAVSRVSLTVRLSLIVALVFANYMSAEVLFHPGTAAWGTFRPTTFAPYLAPSLRGFAMFAAGWLVYLSYRQKDSLSATTAVGTDAISLAILMVAITAQLGVFDRAQSRLLFPFLILGLAVTGRSITAWILASRPLHYLGRISYSIYLLHLLVLSELYDHGPVFFRQNDNRVWVECLISLGLAVLSYEFLEAPSRRLVRRLFSRRLTPSLAG